MPKQNEQFFTEADWAVMLLTDGDHARLLQPCKLMPYDGTVDEPDQPTRDDTSKARQRHAKQARRL